MKDNGMQRGMEQETFRLFLDPEKPSDVDRALDELLFKVLSEMKYTTSDAVLHLIASVETAKLEVRQRLQEHLTK